MNSHESLAYPNSMQHQSPGSVKMLATIVDEQPQKVMPSKRYTRRSSVTRYSLEQMAVPSNSMMSNANYTSTLSYSEEPHLVSEESKGDYEQPLAKVVSPPTITKKSSGRYGRRSSVTRYSLQQTAIPETRSLSPVPFSRRGSSTKITVEQVSPDFTPEEEEQPVAPRPKSRYRRRCSVTKYSLDAAQTVAKQHYAATHQGSFTTPSNVNTTTVAVKVTVEEPIDTVDSIEHRHMLANDTIESSGAGDLIVGWNQATASFMDEDDEASTDGCVADASDGGGEVKEQDDPAIATTVVSPKPIKSSPWWSGKGGSNDEKGEEREGIWGVLQKNFSVSPFWIKNLGNETINPRKKTFSATSNPSIEVEKSILSTPSA